jgi:hypothetical protein
MRTPGLFLLWAALALLPLACAGGDEKKPAATAAAGKRWIRLDLQNVGDTTGLDFGPLVHGSQADPSQ